jgi:hypothetical protein
MDIGNWLTLIGVIIAILVHAFATVWWASKVSATLNNILLALVKIDTEFEKRDIQISKLWERVDRHSESLASHEAQLDNLNK